MGYIADTIRASVPLLQLSADEGASGRHEYTCNAIREAERQNFVSTWGLAEKWYFNWLSEHMMVRPGGHVPYELYSSQIYAFPVLPFQERQSIRLMLLCFAALQAEDDGI